MQFKPKVWRKTITKKFRLVFIVIRKKLKRKPSLLRSQEELENRRKDLFQIRKSMKRDIKKSDNPAELRRELEMLEQTLVEYQWLFKEID